MASLDVNKMLSIGHVSGNAANLCMCALLPKQERNFPPLQTLQWKVLTNSASLAANLKILIENFSMLAEGTDPRTPPPETGVQHSVSFRRNCINLDEAQSFELREQDLIA